MKAQQQDQAAYLVNRHPTSSDSEDDIIRQALVILARRVSAFQTVFSDPNAVRQYLVMRNAAESDQFVERFTVLFLDNQNRMVASETMFTGTLNQTSVYPREVVRAALRPP